MTKMTRLSGLLLAGLIAWCSGALAGESVADLACAKDHRLCSAGKRKPAALKKSVEAPTPPSVEELKKNDTGLPELRGKFFKAKK